MFKTEEEASKCLCPIQCSVAGIQCCGSECMFWRWIDKKQNPPSNIQGIANIIKEITALPDLIADRIANKCFDTSNTRRGYCGLAGKPGE